MKNSILVIILFVAVTVLFYVTFSKLLPSKKTACTNPTVFWSVEKALKNPHSVCILHIHSHTLTAVPPGVANLKNLRVLHLHIKNLKALPLFLKDLKQLQELVIGGNAFAGKRAEIQKLVPYAIISFDYSHEN